MSFDSAVTEMSGAVGFSKSADALPKTYDPAGTESRWQLVWEESGAFHSDPKQPGEPFSVTIATVGTIVDNFDSPV